MAEEQEAVAPKKKSKMLLFIIIGVLLLVVAGAAGFLLLKKKPADSEEGDDSAAHAKTSAHAAAPPTYVKLDSFTTNLAAENPADSQSPQNSQYIQVVVELKVEDAHIGESLKPFTPEIRNGILRALSSKKASQLTTVEGKDALAAEILGVVNRVVTGASSSAKGKEPDGPVTAVLFSSFIIQ